MLRQLLFQELGYWFRSLRAIQKNIQQACIPWQVMRGTTWRRFPCREGKYNYGLQLRVRCTPIECPCIRRMYTHCRTPCRWYLALVSVFDLDNHFWNARAVGIQSTFDFRSWGRCGCLFRCPANFWSVSESTIILTFDLEEVSLGYAWLFDGRFLSWFSNSSCIFLFSVFNSLRRVLSVQTWSPVFSYFVLSFHPGFSEH